MKIGSANNHFSMEGNTEAVNRGSKNRGFFLKKILQGIGFGKSSKSFFPKQGNPLTKFEQQSAYIKHCVAEKKAEMKYVIKEQAKAQREIEKERRNRQEIDKKFDARQEKFEARAQKKSDASYKTFQKAVAREMAGGMTADTAFEIVTAKFDAESTLKQENKSNFSWKRLIGLKQVLHGQAQGAIPTSGAPPLSRSLPSNKLPEESTATESNFKVESYMMDDVLVEQTRF